MSDEHKPGEAPVIDEFLLELQKDFLTEASFLLEACEESYLKLENPEARPEELNKIFRAAHSFKGTGASIGLTDLAELAHVVEDCLSILRTEPHLVTNEIISLLLRAGDAFKVRVAQLQSAAGGTWDVTALRADLLACIESLRSGSASATMAFAPPAHAGAAEHSAKAEDTGPVAEPTAHASSTIKIDSSRVQGVLDIIGELTIMKSQIVEGYRQLGVRNVQHESLMALLDKCVRELQDKSLALRMTALKPVFIRIQRAVRDLSVKLGKPVEFEMHGEDSEIDRGLIDLIGDPLVHIARNAVDHGVEKPDQRGSTGKPTAARVTLSAKQRSGNLVIELTDDGRGIDRKKVAAKAVERGLLASEEAADALSDNEIYQFLFAPGFSTAEVVTDVSGRGVGLDVVQSNIRKVKGTIDIESALGKGSLFRITIPMNATVTRGLLVECDPGSRYLFPLESVRELVQQRSAPVTRLKSGSSITTLRGKVVPVLDFARLVASSRAVEQAPQHDRKILVMENGSETFAVIVSRVLGQVEVMVKPLPDNLSRSRALAGSAILGDGSLALLVDVHSLAKDGARSPDELSA